MKKIFNGTPRPPIPGSASLGTIMASFAKEDGPKVAPVTGLMFRPPEDTQTSDGCWQVYYRTVDFGEFDKLSDAYAHLCKLVELDLATNGICRHGGEI